MAWCEQHGRELDPLSLRDAGVSAFRGKNRAGGALGRFLDLAKKGELGANPVLLIEDLDRFSRAAPLETVESVITDVVRAGVTVVSLRDGLEIGRTTLTDDPGTWFRLLAGVIGAHDHSRKLSERVTSARRSELRAMRAGETRRTNTKPFWLDWDEAAGAFVLNGQAAVVRRMFEMCVDRDWGTHRIAKKLNGEGLRAPRGGAWTTRGVLITLTSPATIGLYQPHRIEYREVTRNGRTTKQRVRVPAGEPFARYPAVVSQGRFQVARERIAARTGRGGPKTMLRFALQDLVTCGCCGQPVTTTSSTSRGRRYDYARCGPGERGRALCGGPLRTHDLLAVVLTGLPQTAWERFHTAGEEPAELTEARQKLTELTEGLVVMRQRHRTLTERVTEAAADGTALSLLKTLQDAADAAAQEIAEREDSIRRMTVRVGGLEERGQPGDAWAALLDHIEGVMRTFGRGEDTVEDRIELHDRLVAMGMRFVLDARAGRIGIVWNDHTEWLSYDADVAVIRLAEGRLAMARFPVAVGMLQDQADAVRAMHERRLRGAQSVWRVDEDGNQVPIGGEELEKLIDDLAPRRTTEETRRGLERLEAFEPDAEARAALIRQQVAEARFRGE